VSLVLVISGCRDIDGIIKPGTTTLFYGEAGIGKTNLLLTIAGNMCREGRCIYIGTEDLLYYEVIARNPEKYENVLFMDIRDFDELLRLVLTTIYFLDYHALFIDSINALYRAVAYREDSLTKYGLLLALLVKKTVDKGTYLFASAQVRIGLREDEEEFVASGMPILEFWFNNIFKMAMDENGRYVEPVKPGLGFRKYYIITDEGVEWIK
jgi:DNA repair protein RadB